MRALVVDDSKTTRMLLRKMLTTLGFQVFEACDGREGLARMKDIGQGDLVLTDWNMPEMNGYEFLRAVRAQAEHNSITVVMVTTHNDPESVVKALMAGADEYIMKPFTTDVIREKLQLLHMLEAAQ